MHWLVDTKKSDQGILNLGKRPSQASGGMTVNHILTDLGFSKDIKVREEALESLTRRITEASVTTRQALAPFAVNADQHQDAVIKSSATHDPHGRPSSAGKTQTIINRVLHRVQQGLKPARTLLLTFDNAAVNSIKLKLHDKLAELAQSCRACG